MWSSTCKSADLSRDGGLEVRERAVNLQTPNHVCLIQPANAGALMPPPWTQG